MTINDIAKLAGVSISTVSKIVNGKDKNMNAETRERVLKIVKEYNYTPYASVKNISNAKTFMIGVMLNRIEHSYSFLKGILDIAKKNGYNAIICDNNYDEEEELKNISALCKNNVDGVIWEKSGRNSLEHKKYFDEFQIPVLFINDKEDESVSSISYEILGYASTKHLVDFKHNRIGCIIEEGSEQSKQFLKGYQRCLFECNIQYTDKMKIVYDRNTIYEEVLLKNPSGIVCDNSYIALEVYAQALRHNYKIPENLSIVSLWDGAGREAVFSKLSYIAVPFYEFGRYICEHIITQMEKQAFAHDHFLFAAHVSDNSSVSIPYILKSKKIIVVGSINMDVIINVDELPQVGKTVRVGNCAMIPGGKGTNQAIAAAKLGWEVALIAKIGKDYDGNHIYEAMCENHVDMQGVAVDPRDATGKAYIHVQNDGESSIAIYPGANQHLSSMDIDRHKHLFKNSGFCLIQTELPAEVVEYAASLAKENSVKIILKPSAVDKISDSLFEKLNFFVPNKKEADILCPHKHTLEEKADYFLSKGVGTVIITLGHKGCYLKNKDYNQYFPAADFVPVDTTGAADAFVAALAVYLLESYELPKAIEYATCAAGFAITRQGVVPALIDRDSLEMYVGKQRTP